METINGEKTAHTSRITPLLAAQGVGEVTIARCFEAWLEEAKTADGRPLPPGLKSRLVREFERLVLAVEQIRQLQMQQAEMLRLAAREVARVAKDQRQSSRVA